MSMRFANKRRTLCEVLREINDYHQNKHKHDNRIRALCAEAELMGKKMARKLFEYSKEYDKDWWAANPLYRDKLIKRLSDNYHFEVSEEMKASIMANDNSPIEETKP